MEKIDADVLLDANIVLRFLNTADALHPVCWNAIQSLLKGERTVYVCAQVCIEFWVVATRPVEVNGLGLSVTKASEGLQRVRGIFTLLPEPPDMATLWQQTAQQYAVSGRQAHDCRLATLMQAHGITHLLTLNESDFARYPFVTCLRPEAVAAPAN